MPQYRRAFAPGGTFFFTLVTYDRQPFLCTEPARNLLRSAIALCRQQHPFVTEAFVLLPDHLHTLWTLPDDDADFAIRWGKIKKAFTQGWEGEEAVVSASRQRNRRRGVWQRRFWEHLVRDQEDFNRILDYIHYNPVKHGLCACPHGWPYSSFRRWVAAGGYEADWGCSCDGQKSKPPDFSNLDGVAEE